MIKYPKIPNSSLFPLEKCFAFEKYDGSNIRAEWNCKSGFCKFGTRNRLFDKNDEVFGEAIELFMNKYSSSLEEIFKNKYRKIREITVFGEFLGKESFAGLHKKNDPKDIVLFDVWIYKYGLIGPEKFINDFGALNIAKVVYNGKFGGKFAEDVRNGKYNVNEGVVCKAGEGARDLRMCKIKTNSYLAKLKEVYANNWQDFWE